ncbi:hypothetical protein [Shewanella spartinae]|uniref:hypothetical protein n=1 Tax=Shewanella spartinae TaxID=2864205 RepID=UPI001C66173E|nr:hypothetical protein [Shewanella spartinae]QYJ94385.1 hypothetical protein K0I31_03065 [Shewanella spartinae]
MVEKIRQLFANTSIILLSAFCLWNLYTIIFYGYVTNGVWETYYREEPLTFIVDSLELLAIPVLILVIFPLMELFSRKQVSVPTATKVKRLRRKKRKKKRKD